MESARPRFDDLLQCVTQLPNGELTQQLRQLNEQKCVRDAELLLYLSELDQRGLYRKEAVSSLFDFCVSRLGCSEDVAWKRVGAARLMRQFPLVFDLLCTGRIHLSALMLIKPHLTEENHREWLFAASGKSKRQVEKLVACRCPKPDVATSIRKLPDSRPPHGGPITNHATATAQTSIAEDETPTTTATSITETAPPIAEDTTPSGTLPEAAPHRAVGSTALPAARIAPLSASSYRVTFTASERWKQKLERARELASHVISPSDLPALLERALDLLIEREERRRCAFGVKSRATAKHRQTTKRQADAARQAAAQSQADPECHAAERQADPERPSAPECHAAVQRQADPERHGDEHHAAAKRVADTKQQPCQMRDLGDVAAQDPGRAAESSWGDRILHDATSGQFPPAKPRSRYVPAAVRREIWERDQGRCTFTDAQGNRCEERCFLDIEHLQPFALNGATSTSNCTLRCRSHNMLAAEMSFGSRQIASAIARARER